jgi:hypothetical protein
VFPQRFGLKLCSSFKDLSNHFDLTLSKSHHFPRVLTYCRGHKALRRGTDMRIFIICAILITGTVGLGGCFHHQKAVTQEPLKLG